MRHIHSPRSPRWPRLALLILAASLAACTTFSPAPTATQPAPAAQATPTAQLPAPSMQNIIPRPAKLIETGGTFVLTAAAGIYVDPGSPEVQAVGQYLADHLNPATGFGLQIRTMTAPPPNGSILLSLNGADPALGGEGYQLTVTPGGIRILANQSAGLFYGVQTLRQLLPAAIDSASLQPGPWVVGTGSIIDQPRFAWRGTMLDVARHFFSVSDLTQYIDLLAYYKINRLHLHLSDDQGWRIQINQWPNLTLYGGSQEVGGTPGGYYSQSDYTYIVNYARSRYITIVPEIDMPGHVTAALASYPELTCDGVPPALFTATDTGFSTLCTEKPETMTFVADVLAELAALTPGPYLHIGGDEAGATDPVAYQQFMRQVQGLVRADGKTAVGWEEIAQGVLLSDTVVQHWNLKDSYAPNAVQAGAKLIMSPSNKAYMDMKYDETTPLGQDWAGTINVQTAYDWDPANTVAGVNENDLLGVEAPLWSETLVSLADVEYMAFPRLLGYAEIGWTPQNLRSWNTYSPRLAAQGPRLTELGVNFYHTPEIVWPAP